MYGTAELRAHYAPDGTVTSIEVVRAASVILVAREIWAELSVDEEGCFFLDTAKTYRYRKVRDDERGVICERVYD